MPHALRFHRPTVAAAVAAALAVGTAAPAVAAEPAADGLLQEVVVTAQKRAESAQDVPISIVALSGQALERLNTTDALEIAGRTPSLQFSAAGGEAQLYVRGVGTNLLGVGSDPSVAVHQDGVYLARPNMGLAQFLDVERVEVLRGPQGTLYGRNATGGAVNLVSRMPTRETEGYVALGTGSFERLDARAAWSGPVNDALSLRFAGRKLRDEGFVDNLFPGGTDVEDNDLETARAIARIEPNDRFRLDLMVDWTQFRNGNTSIVPLDSLGAAQQLGAVPTGSIHETRNNVPSFQEWETGGPTATLEIGLPLDLTLTYVAAYRSFEQDFLFNTDGTEIEVTRTSIQADTHQQSHELRVASAPDAPFEWIAGAYYLREKKAGALGLVRLNPAVPFVFVLPAEGTTTAYAAFGELGWSITQDLKLTGGIRWSEEKKTDFSRAIQVPLSATNPIEQIRLGLYGNLARPNAFASKASRDRWSAWTPKLGIEYRLDEGRLLYATYTEGFKSGGYNSFQVPNPAIDAFDPEEIKSFEVGAKTDWFDGRLRVNASAFHYDYTDLQVTSFFQSLTLTTNAAEASVRGVDLDLLASPFPGLQFGLSASWLDATYDEFRAPYGVCRPPVLGDPSCAGATSGSIRAIDASGNRLTNAPEIKATAFASYEFALGAAGTLALYAQASHTDDLYFNAANDANLRVAAYTLLDARIGWTSPGGGLELSLSGRNLGDEEYFHNIVQFTSTSYPPSAPGPGGVITDPFSVGNALGYPAPGRTWALDLTYRF